jgi:beta-glucosidase
MILSSLVAVALCALSAKADILTGMPDPAPPGYEEWMSPIVCPAYLAERWSN